MNSPRNGSAQEHELEKFPEFEEDPDVLLDAEPEQKIVVPAHDCSSHSNGKTNPIDAGNRGLDHCAFILNRMTVHNAYLV